MAVSKRDDVFLCWALRSIARIGSDEVCASCWSSGAAVTLDADGDWLCAECVATVMRELTASGNGYADSVTELLRSRGVDVGRFPRLVSSVESRSCAVFETVVASLCAAAASLQAQPGVTCCPGEV